MKKVIFTLLMVSLIGAAIGIGTWAAFSDVETSPGNMFTAGTMDLKVDGEDDPDITIYFDNIECVKPGDSDEVLITLTNVGCVDGIADIHVIITEDSENGIEEPESYVDTWTDVDGDTYYDPAIDIADPEGELAESLDMRITADIDGDGVYEYLVEEGKVRDLDCINVDFAFLAGVTAPPYSHVDIKIEWWVHPDLVGNEIMTDILKFDIEFSLNQAMAAVLNVVNIQQPDAVQPCDLITIAVDVKNTGGAEGEGTVDVVVTPPVGAPIEILDVPTGMIQPLTTVKVPIIADLHAEDAWMGGTIIVSAQATDDAVPVPDPPCEIAVVEPFNCLVVGIQQPETIVVCEELVIAIDVHNFGAKTGECYITWMVVDPGTQQPIYDPDTFIPVMGVAGPIVTPPSEVVKVPVEVGGVKDWWPDMVMVLAWCEGQAPPGVICPIVILPPPPPPIPPVSTELGYLVDYLAPVAFGIDETDHPFDVHVAAHDVLPESPTLCTTPPAVLSVYLDVDTNPGATIFEPPQRVFSLFGVSMGMQYFDSDLWLSMNDLTDVFEVFNMKPPIPGVEAQFESYTDTFNGTQPGWPYCPIPSEYFSYVWNLGGYVKFLPTFEGCVPPIPFYVKCHVEGLEEITVPGGTFDTIHILCNYQYIGWDDDGDARDSDLDCFPDGQELREGTDPYDPTSHPPEGTNEPPINWIDEDWPDGVDNDGDGAIDEDQPGADNDGDGLWDEDPVDTVDNDGDGLVDEDAVDAGPPPDPGSREIWFAPDIGASGAMVKQININAPFPGTETWELNTVGP